MATTTTYATLKETARDANYDGLKTRDDRTIARSIAAALGRLTDDCRWSFMRDKYRIVTVAPVTVNVTATPASTTIVDIATNFTDAMVGCFLEVNGEQKYYEIASKASTSILELVNAYQGPTAIGTTSDSLVVKPAIDLPAAYSESIKLITVSSGPRSLNRIDGLDMEQRQSEYAGSSQPICYAIRTKRNLTGKQIWFYPPPDAVYEFDLIYHRRAGWLDATTQAWKVAPTQDTDIVTWPDEQLPLLRKAIHMCLAEEMSLTPVFLMKQQAYMRALVPAMAADNDHGEPILLGREKPSGWGVIGSRINF